MALYDLFQDVYQQIGLQGERLENEVQRVVNHMEQELFISDETQLRAALHSEHAVAVDTRENWPAAQAMQLVAPG